LNVRFEGLHLEVVLVVRMGLPVQFSVKKYMKRSFEEKGAGLLMSSAEASRKLPLSFFLLLFYFVTIKDNTLRNWIDCKIVK
jgi:hypothetical protein